MVLEFTDWTLFTGMVGWGVHVTTLITYGFMGLASLWYCYRNKLRLDMSIIFIGGIGLFNVGLYEFIFGQLNDIFATSLHYFSDYVNMFFMVSIVMELLFGMGFLYIVMKVENIKLRFDRWFFIMIVVTMCLWIIWIIAPFPFVYVTNRYFPQTVYILNGQHIYIFNDYIRFLNIFTKFIQTLAFIYLFLGRKKENVLIK